MLLFIMVVVWRLMEDEKAKIFCRRKMKDVSTVEGFCRQYKNFQKMTSKTLRTISPA